MIRTVENWMMCIGNADATHEGDAQAAARRILGDIIGYAGSGTRQYDSWVNHDIQQLANALQAYARLLHQTGVTP
jgi:hypothetical protein